jgi:hypothetical protein
LGVAYPESCVEREIETAAARPTIEVTLNAPDISEDYSYVPDCCVA